MRVLLALLVLSSTAYADDSLRCGSRLVSVDAHMEEVVAQCGPPTSAARRESKRALRGLNLHCVEETWTYDLGPQDFVRVLGWVDGVLTTIEVGGYGRAR